MNKIIEKAKFKKVFWQFLSFSLIGTGGFIVDLGIYYVVYPMLGEFAGRLTSFFMAVLFTYSLNSFYTFKKSLNDFWVKFFPYFISMLGGGAINIAVFILINRIFSLSPDHAYCSIAAGSVAGLAFNFGASVIIFRK